MRRVELRGSWKIPAFLVGVVLAVSLTSVIAAADIALVVASFATLGVVIAIATLMVFSRLVVDDDGVTVSRPLRAGLRIRWEDLDHYTYGMQPRQWTVTLSVFDARGASIDISSAYGDFEEAFDLALDTAHARLRARERRDYKPFELQEHALVHKKHRALPLGEIEDVQVTGYELVIRKRDKAFAWERLRLDDVRNALLLVEELAERGVSVTMASAAYVPRSPLARIAVASVRHGHEPRGREP